MQLQIESFEQITPEFLEQFRTERDLSLAVFWNAIGCSDTRGFRYEKKKTEIPEVVKRLVYLHYGVGIPTDCQSAEFLKFRNALRSTNAVRVVQAASLIQQAKALLLGEAEVERG